jgi:hypothetical protein
MSGMIPDLVIEIIAGAAGAMPMVLRSRTSISAPQAT